MNSFVKKSICLILIGIQTNLFAQTIITISGTGTAGFSGDGGAATSAKVNLSTSICRDFYGNIFIADRSNHRIRKIDFSTGNISTVAGTGTAGFSGDGGLATNAQLNQPIGVTVSMDGTIFISDNTNNRIRKVDANGIITTYAGTGVAGYSGDGGQATLAKLNLPWGVFLDKSGNLYIADRSNDRVRKIDNTGIISTVAGTGTAGYSGNGGLAINAKFDKPISLSVDTAYNIFIADENNNRVRKVTYSTGIVSLVAGTGTATYSGDGGAAISASLNKPCGVAVDLSGNIYISDRMNQRLRKVNTSGIISTIAGTGTVGFSGDGGNATAAKINYPRELFSDGSGNIYFADTDNNRIRKITYCNFPSIPSLSASSYNAVCKGTNDTLKISSGKLNDALNWEWYSGTCGGTHVGSGISIIVAPDATTTYFVRGEGACVTPYACANFTVTVNTLPDTPGTIKGAATVCSGSVNTYSITPVSGATSYSWTLPDGWAGNSTTHSISAKANDTDGNITVTANNTCGKSNPQTLAVTVNLIDTSVDVSDVVLSANAIGAKYQWIDCLNGNKPISGDTNQRFTTATNGKFAVIISQNGCTDTSTCYNVYAVGLENNVDQTAINIFPNPTYGKFTILNALMNGTREGSIEIYSILGQQIFFTQIQKSGLVQIDISDQPQGIYFLKLQTNKKFKLFKLIKE